MKDALPSPLKVIKIGGNVLDNPEALTRFADDFASIQGSKILVHGGGKEATRLAARLGIESVMIEGRRVTDTATLEVVTMVYAGLINKRLVGALQARGCDALGLSGADANVIVAKRRDPRPVDYGHVGDISPDNVNSGLILSMVKKGIVPVFCSIMHDGGGALLNCNADSVATVVAVSCASSCEVDLCFCFEKAGVLADVADDGSVIPVLSRERFDHLLASGHIHHGMIPKLTNAFKALEAGVRRVEIKNSENLLTSWGTILTQ